ncbi:MAG: hypothetical protein LBC12_01810 [Nitrososphaerota archaeon]|jgi:hypothetical protein|nr:hypothetical protein [Nitrososphaerota archaeon]
MMLWSLTLNVVLGLFLVLGYMSFPSSAKVLIKKKFGLLKGKMLNVVAYQDRDVVIEAHTVSSEGCAESKRANKLTKRFYFASPLKNMLNVEENRRNAERDKTILPSYMIDGMPVTFSYITTGVTTNPAVITALKLSDYAVDGQVKAEITLPKEDAVIGKTAEVELILPFDPSDIQRNFPKSFNQEMLHSTNLRWESIGVAKTKARDTSGTAKIIIVAAVVCCIALIVAGLLGGGHIG